MARRSNNVLTAAEWELFPLEKLEAHARELKALNVTPGSNFTAVLRRKRADARAEAQANTGREVK
jgi:hypothetical protein